MVEFELDWKVPPPKLTLTKRDVHLWRVSLDQSKSILRQLQALLAVDERARADRFRFELDRRRFIAARGALRTILGGYLGIAPHQVQFRSSPNGKPMLATFPDRDDLQFNLSHSRELAVCAIARHQIGVDLEYMRPVPDAEEIAERYFSVSENAVFRALPADEKREAFFNCWTRKEAFIKALGDGLMYPLDRFEVSLTPGEPARLIRVEGDAQAVQQWSFRQITPEPDHTAALAVEASDWHLSCWNWERRDSES